jgi:hypothetical protein
MKKLSILTLTLLVATLVASAVSQFNITPIDIWDTSEFNIWETDTTEFNPIEVETHRILTDTELLNPWETETQRILNESNNTLKSNNGRVELITK